jgi:hypothetical protein
MCALALAIAVLPVLSGIIPCGGRNVLDCHRSLGRMGSLPGSSTIAARSPYIRIGLPVPSGETGKRSWVESRDDTGFMNMEISTEVD